ncbi:MAG TPA: hypothetical protein VMA95_09670 [Streptosporangiaceae bacterium]|nr:hypothetical protein [Streptosporangiaceae bacterium]
MTLIVPWPVVTRDRIVRAFRPGVLATSEAPFRTLRRHGWVSTGVRVARHGDRGLAGQMTIFSSLNVVAARLARRGDASAAERVASAAASLESGEEFAGLRRLLSALPSHEAERVVAGDLPADRAPLAEMIRALANHTEQARPGDIMLTSPAEVIFAGQIAELTDALVVLVQAPGSTTIVPRWMANAAHRDQVGEFLALVADQIDGASAVVEAVPAIDVPAARFSPFGRGDNRATAITADDVRLLSGEPEPLRILIPVTIEE